VGQADGLRRAWAREGVTAGTLQLPFGEMPAEWCMNQQISDLAVHAWDVARVTGQSTDLDPEVGQAAFDWARHNLTAQFRGEESDGAAFGPEVPVPVNSRRDGGRKCTTIDHDARASTPEPRLAGTLCRPRAPNRPAP